MEPTKTPCDDTTTFHFVEVNPMFPGGESELLRYLAKNLIYPQKAKQDSIEGKVLVGFIIDKTGDVNHAKVLRSLSPECDSEAIRLILSMPDWTPAMHCNKPADVSYSIPVNFRL